MEFSSFHNHGKFDRASAVRRHQRACTSGQMVNDQLANQNARFIQVML